MMATLEFRQRADKRKEVQSGHRKSNKHPWVYGISDRLSHVKDRVEDVFLVVDS